MGIQSYDWDILYDRAQRYLRRYDPEIRINRGTQTFYRSPQVDASFPMKGKKKLLETLKKDPQIVIRRGSNMNGVRYAQIAVRFRLDGTLEPCDFGFKGTGNQANNKKEGDA